LTDENDSEVDARAFGGTAWNFMSTKFNPPRGTSVCATQPGSSGCTSCAFGKNGGDSECMNEGGFYTAQMDQHNWGYDLNLRHVHEKQKYGVSVQFPIQRYVLGLTSPRVPNRDTEYPQGAQSYQGNQTGALKCINPLYAAKLPTGPAGGSWNPTSDELCNLTPGTRKPALVYYAHIGGVPHQLLQQNPMDPNSPQKDQLTEPDWQLILGKDPENWDYSGIDPHMVESYNQRTGVPVPPGGFAVADQSQPEGSDPISGREWTTDSVMAEHTGLLVDREYACIFKLEKVRDCSGPATTADPTLQDSCDCQPPDKGGAFTHAQIPAVCNDSTPTQQDSAKAYPTIRELELAHLLGAVPGANVGIISSLCPIHTTDMGTASAPDPLFGYRPAMNAIIAALSKTLAHQCLPQRLTVDPATMKVPCLVLGTFPSGPGAPTACTDQILNGAYEDPEPIILKEFRADQHAAFVAGGSLGTDPSAELTCQLKQLTPQVPCDTQDVHGWCYVDQTGTSKGCAQEILFSKDALRAGVTTSLQCLEASSGIGANGAVGIITPGATGDAGH
jgi:hypothetical protein